MTLKKQFPAASGHDLDTPIWLLDYEDDLIEISTNIRRAGARPEDAANLFAVHAVTLLVVSGMPIQEAKSRLCQIITDAASGLQSISDNSEHATIGGSA